jgi:hypothetical protein
MSGMGRAEGAKPLCVSQLSPKIEDPPQAESGDSRGLKWTSSAMLPYTRGDFRMSTVKEIQGQLSGHRR